MSFFTLSFIFNCLGSLFGVIIGFNICKREDNYNEFIEDTKND